MMKTQKRTTSFIGLGCILVILVCLIAIAIPGQKAASAFTGQAPNFTTTYTRADFLSDTNTFNATSVNPSALEMTYDLSARNNNTVMAVPQITVLTHGLGGDAGDWSNGYSATNTSTSFAYDSDSLISKLSERAGDADIYRAVILDTDKEDFDLIELSVSGNSYNAQIKDSIDSVSNHIIIVFQAEDNMGGNDSVYYEFNFMLSRIVYDVKCLNGGILPKVNLIGHSRGGITNLQYALDHPDMVASLISIGTPYFGTTSGDIYKLFVEGGADLTSIHDYSRKIRLPDGKGRPAALTEYGGISHIVKEHVEKGRIKWGYQKIFSRQEYGDKVLELLEECVAPLIGEGLCASVYTQVADVEGEINGIMTYDRKVIKIDIGKLKEASSKMVIRDESCALKDG